MSIMVKDFFVSSSVQDVNARVNARENTHFSRTFDSFPKRKVDEKKDSKETHCKRPLDRTQVIKTSRLMYL